MNVRYRWNLLAFSLLSNYHDSDVVLKNRRFESTAKMLNWAKQTCVPKTCTIPFQTDIGYRLGVTEPIYGPSAIQSVANQTEEKSHTELTKDDLQWECMDSTNVETKTFYMISDDGVIGLAQVIYSNVM